MKLDFADSINVMQGIDQNIFKRVDRNINGIKSQWHRKWVYSESSSQKRHH